MASQLYKYTPEELQKLLDESNSYKELLRKVGMCDHGNNYSTLRKVISEYKLDVTQINTNRKNINKKQIENLHSKRKKSLDEILVENSTYTNTHNLKERLFSEGLKEEVCENCGLTEWLGKPIALQLHHSNGVRNDNRLENLKILCPNCHAQTDTYAGKNVKHEKKIKGKTKNKKERKPAKFGVSDDKQRYYDGYGGYKILCPKCKTNYMSKDSKMCIECSKIERKRPKISKEELLKILENNTYTSAANLLGVYRKTVSQWYKYYINEEKQQQSIQEIE